MVETADRPGLLVDLVKIITDINIEVQSGEFDTEVIINILRMDLVIALKLIIFLASSVSHICM